MEPVDRGRTPDPVTATHEELIALLMRAMFDTFELELKLHKTQDRAANLEKRLSKLTLRFAAKRIGD